MSLSAALQIGRSALAASQLGIQVAGNNMANAATVGYSRQRIDIESIRGDQSVPGGGAGRGVRVSTIRRQVDGALQARLTGAGADAAGAQTQQRIFEQIETTLGELGTNDLSNELSNFFKVWSERANQTKASGSVVQQGDRLARFVRELRTDLTSQRRQIDDQIDATVVEANELLESVARLNKAISTSEGSGAPANTLRDQRDQVIEKLAQIMDVSVIDRGLGGLDVLVGSAPVVLADRAKLLEVLRVNSASGTSVTVRTTGEQGQDLGLASGSLGSLLMNRSGAVDATIDRLDTLASSVIFEINKLHSTATNATGMVSNTGTLGFSTADRARALNDAANESTNGLPFAATNGGFLVQVRERSTGAMQTVRVNVDLDNVTAAGLPGADDDTSAEDIRASLDGIAGLNATFTADGKLSIVADDGFDFSFSDDSSGALAVLGVNAYFTGKSGADIAVRTDLLADSTKLATGRMVNGQFVENGTALEMARLQDRSAASLGGVSFADHWRDTSQQVSGATASATTNAQARAMVFESLASQRDALSGVNIDEESIGLMDYQRQYQAAARVISTVDQMTQSLLALL
jgi:flagellar hook-associated protein 1 FlgK